MGHGGHATAMLKIPWYPILCKTHVAFISLKIHPVDIPLKRISKKKHNVGFIYPKRQRRRTNGLRFLKIPIGDSRLRQLRQHPKTIPKRFGDGRNSGSFSKFHNHFPIGSMYATSIYGNIYHQYTPNVSIYTRHGSYGFEHVCCHQKDDVLQWSLTNSVVLWDDHGCFAMVSTGWWLSHPSEKWWSSSMGFGYEMENKIHLWNHKPEIKLNQLPSQVLSCQACISSEAYLGSGMISPCLRTCG
jgi:hypothetical protein